MHSHYSEISYTCRKPLKFGRHTDTKNTHARLISGVSVPFNLVLICSLLTIIKPFTSKPRGKN